MTVEAEDQEQADSSSPGESAFTFPFSSLLEHMGSLEHEVAFIDVGTVLKIGDGVATLSGLRQARTEELVTFPTGVQGLVLTLNSDQVDVILLGSDQGIQGGDLVYGTGKRIQVPVGDVLLGRVIDPLGQPQDDLGPISFSQWLPLERDAPGIIERQPVEEPLYTGLKAIDALIPIGRGQRELIIGDRQTGKTAIALDAIISQKDSDVLCVYVTVGKKKSATLADIRALTRYGAMDHTIVVVGDADAPPALRYLAPYAGCSMAEFFMDQGRHVLIVYDDLTKHADAYRELSLLLRRPPGREAFPGDIFYLHARLLERACKLSNERGAGSITALPIIETQRGNLARYIPTNLISITDGQIVLETAIFNRGRKPAINVGLSVSRVGGTAQVRAMRDLAEELRLKLAQFEEVAHFARFGTEVDEATRREIAIGEHLQATLVQPQFSPLSLADQVLILYTATHGYMDDVPVPQVPEFEERLRAFLWEEQPSLLRDINSLGELTPEIQNALGLAVSAFKEQAEAQAK